MSFINGAEPPVPLISECSQNLLLSRPFHVVSQNSGPGAVVLRIQRGAHDCGLRATAASFSLPPSLARVHRTAVSPSARQSVSRSLVRSFVRAPPLQRTCAPGCSTVETVLVCMRCCTAPLSLSVYSTRTVLQHCSFRPAVSAGGKSGTARPSFDRSFRSCAAPLLSPPSLARP